MPENVNNLDFLKGGGNLAEIILSKDWSATELGPIKYWPQSLRTTVSICLRSKFPILIWWGKDLTLIYNDAYIPIFAGKHPLALGSPGLSTRGWGDPEVKAVIEPMLQAVMTKGEATWSDDQLLILERKGYPEEAYFTWSYSPIQKESGEIGGVFTAVTETTDKVIGQRRLQTLRNLAELAIESKSVDQALKNVGSILIDNPLDVPYFLLYSISSNKKNAHLSAYSANLTEDSIQHTDILLENKDIWSIYEVIESCEPKEIAHPGNFLTNIPSPWPEAPKLSFVIPILLPGQKEPYGVFIVGISSRLPFNDNCKSFLKLVTDQIAASLSTVLAHEAERKRAEALAEIDAAKTVFFSNISHEFRTPITLMLGPLEEVINKPDGVLSNLTKTNLEVVHRNTMRLLKLVNGLLDFSRIESGRQQAKYALTDISQFTKNLASNFQSVMEKAGLQFEVNADAFIQPVYIDKDMWEKIVFNLLSNAFKFTLKGKITLSINAENNHAVLKVTDTGVGIPKEELPNLFQRFHRIQATTGRSFEGTGIGLSMIKELVKLLGGEILVESELNKGSTFEVKIPFGKKHILNDHVGEEEIKDQYIISSGFIEEAETLIKDQDSNDIEISDTCKEKILIVDDNADMRKHLKSLLISDYNIETAANGMEALHKINQSLPKLIISDIMMPIINGIELLKQIKSDPKSSHIPFILLTARAGEESKIEGYETGADDYLVKPFSSKELKARIKTQLRVSSSRKNADQLLNNLFLQAPVAISIFKGRDLVCEFANDPYLEIVKKERQDFIGKPLFESLPETKEILHPIAMNLLDTGEPFPASEFELVLNRNGENQKCFFNSIWTPLKDEDSNIIGMICCAHEVTDQVLARGIVKNGR